MEIGGRLTRGTAVEEGETEKVDTKRRGRVQILHKGPFYDVRYFVILENEY